MTAGRLPGALVLTAILTAGALPPLAEVAALGLTVSPRPHPPILVLGDEGFRGPVSGVSSGSGTPEDPYRIEGLLISGYPGPFGIRLVGTRAHLHVVNVTIIGGWYALDLEEVSNVTVRGLLVTGPGGTGVRIQRSADVEVETARLGYPPHADVTGLDDGFTVTDSHRVEIRRVTVGYTATLASVIRSEDIRFHDAHFDGRVSWNQFSKVVDSRGVSFERTHFRNTTLFLGGEVQDLALSNSRMSGSLASLMSDSAARLDRARICGTSFEGYDAGVETTVFPNLRMEGNRFVGNKNAANIGLAYRLVFERNLVEGAEGIGLLAHAVEGRIQNNSFVGNGEGVVVGGRAAVLTFNWWGDASGPSGVGPGTGEYLDTDPWIPYAPWATSPPDLTSPCGGPAEAPGSDRNGIPPVDLRLDP